MKLSVGIPKEIKTLEKRVGLTPAGAENLVRSQILVLVEKDAGVLSGFSDEMYRKSGAKIMPDAESLYREADVIQKIKEPQLTELKYLKPEHILFSFLHLASQEQCKLLEGLLGSRCTAIAFETISVNGKNPILATMSRIAGALSVAYAALFKKWNISHSSKVQYPPDYISDMERIANAYPACPANISAGKIVIWGAGVAGTSAIQSALTLSESVSVIEVNAERVENLKKEIVNPKVKFYSETPDKKSLEEADVFIGCVHRAGHRAEKVLSKNLLESASRNKKKIIMDISVDQGGNFPETRSTTYRDPLYFDSFGNLRFSVSNIPSFAGAQASRDIETVTLDYTRALALGCDGAFKQFPELLSALNLRDGKIIYSAIKEVHQK